MSSAYEELYHDAMVDFLESLWGDGYLSPGGPEEVARVLEGIDVAGMSVLDIGCGSGGITVALARDHGAARVNGIDVEATVCDSARRRVEAAGLSERVEIRHVSPGPLDFPAASFDLVFSKDAIVHIADKESLAREIFRVLRPGGWFAASDWLTDRDAEPSAEMRRYLELEGLDFGMASPERYRNALTAAGFVDVSLSNRNSWYRQLARAERAAFDSPDRPKYEAAIGVEGLEKMRKTWEAMIVVLDSGEHCPHHLRGRKPKSQLLNAPGVG